MNNLIEERDERTRSRKKRKKKMDSIIGLSHDEKRNTMKLSSIMALSDTKIRLLDEGFCDNGFVLKKGTLEKFLKGENEYIRGWKQTDEGWEQTEVLNLTDDFTGTVNLGHMEFATFPFIVGEWKKNDLSLVDIGDGRNALDVDLRLDKESVFVKELARQPYDIGVSAEFYYHINDEDTESLSEMMGTYLPVIDEVYIFAYGLVGECGNVNSSGLELKGATMSEELKKELMAEEVDIEVEVEGEEEATENLEEIEEEVAELSADEDADPEAGAEESADEQVSEEAPDEGDESTEGEADEEADEGEINEAGDGDDDEADEAELSYADLYEQVKSLAEEVERLKDIEAKYTALKKNHRRVNRKLAEEKEAKAEFLAKTQELSAELFENEGAAEAEKEEEAKKLAQERKYYKGDGIAD